MRDDRWRRVKRLFEIARWECGPHQADRHGWALNNSLTAYYARALMRENEDLKDFFATREIKSV